MNIRLRSQGSEIDNGVQVEKIIERLLKILPKKVHEGASDSFTAFTYFVINISTLLIYFAFYFLYIKLNMREISNFCAFGELMSITALIIFYRTGRTIVPGNLIMASGTSILTSTALNSGGLHSPAIFWFAVTVALSSFVINRASTVFWTVVFIAIVFALYFHEFFGVTITNSWDPGYLSITRFAHAVVTLLTMAVYSITYHTMQDMTRAKITKTQEALTSHLQENKNLVRVLCHDIMNPLAIIGLAAQVRKGMTQEQIERRLEHIRTAVQTTKDIINQVRTFQAIEDGKHKVELSAISLREMIEKAKFIFRDQLEQKNINLDWDGVDATLLAEPISFSNNVLNNLVSNAIKFSFSGSTIKIKSKVTPDLVLITIIDEGIGIPADILKNLFRTEMETSRKGTNGEPGTGYGMPIVKSYVLAYGGEIQVESRSQDDYPLNHGSSFTLILKNAMSATSPNRSESAPSDAA